MLNLLTIDKKDIESLTLEEIKAAEKLFNNGWWKGFGWAFVCFTLGIAIAITADLK